VDGSTNVPNQNQNQQTINSTTQSVPAQSNDQTAQGISDQSAQQASGQITISSTPLNSNGTSPT
jgi:hypothetical protein